MKDIFKLLICISLCVGLFSQCTGIPDGYIPESIGIAQNEVVVQRGVDFRTQKPDLNGASYPVHFSLEEVTDENGNPTTVLTDPVTTRVWLEPYNYETDKTMEDIYAKMDITNAPVLQVSEASGQLRFTTGTSEITGGTYKISLRMTNSAGTRVYKDVLTAKVQTEEEADSYWVQEMDAYSWNAAVGSWNGTAETAAKYDVQWNKEGENIINLIICDKHGTPFSWQKGEVILRGDRASLEKIAFEPPVYTDEKAIYRYPFAPYPLGNGGSEGYIYSYRLPAKYVEYDDPKYSGFCNFVFAFRAYQDGEWTVKLTFPTISKVSQ